MKIDDFTILTVHLQFSMKVHYARGFFPNENFPGGGGGREHIHPKMGPNFQGGHKTK